MHEDKFDEIKDGILPWIYAESPSEKPDPALLCKEFVAGLHIAFALDQEDDFVLLSQEDLPPSMTVDDLYSQAKSNLTKQVEFTLTGTSFGGYGILAGGEFEPSALCLDFIWNLCAKEIGEDLIICLPDRDSLFMALASSPEQVDGMKHIAREIYQHSNYRLSDCLLRFHVADGSFSAFGKL